MVDLLLRASATSRIKSSRALPEPDRNNQADARQKQSMRQLSCMLVPRSQLDETELLLECRNITFTYSNAYITYACSQPKRHVPSLETETLQTTWTNTPETKHPVPILVNSSSPNPLTILRILIERRLPKTRHAGLSASPKH